MGLRITDREPGELRRRSEDIRRQHWEREARRFAEARDVLPGQSQRDIFENFLSKVRQIRYILPNVAMAEELAARVDAHIRTAEMANLELHRPMDPERVLDLL